MDLGTRVPATSQLYGLDISFQATPAVDWLPSSVNMRYWNIREPVLEDLIENYDIVHVRYLCLVLSDEEISGVLENVVKLISEYPHPCNLPASPMRPHCYTGSNLQAAEDARLRHTWVNRLPDLFETAGTLTGVLRDMRDPPGYMAWAMHETMLLLHERVVCSMGNASIAKGGEQLLPLVVRQGRDGACWAFTKWTVVGSKPMKATEHN